VLRHSAADALGSIGVVVAGGVVLAGGSPLVDPVVGLLIALLVLASSWKLIKEPIDVLMETAPTGLDVDQIGAAICSEGGVRSVHDLHVWTVTAGFAALAAHVVVAVDADRDLIRRRLEVLLAERFEIEHTTLQMEEEAGEALLEVENASPGR
jgi:cobalt-zinc-cadmium efflux system protein